MADGPVRVVLLARAGEARDQLHKALGELGADIVAEGDPAELDPAPLMALPPNMVLVSLEPAIEDALERFDDLLAAPGVEVMYDDAEVTRQLDGWDLARWARHLAAKLVGSDVLPPVPDTAGRVNEFDLSPVPGAPPTPAELMDGERLEDYAAEAGGLAGDVPSTPSLTDEPGLDDIGSLADHSIDLGEMSLDMDMGDIELALKRMDQETGSAPAAKDEPADEGMALDESFNLDVDLASLNRQLSSGDDAMEPAPGDAGPLLADLNFDSETPVKFSNFSGGDELATAPGMDDDVAALAAQLDAYDASDTREAPRDMDFGQSAPRAPAGASAAAAAAAASAPSTGRAPVADKPKVDFGSLSLTPLDDEPLPPPPPPDFGRKEPPAAKPAKSSFGNLSLEGESAPAEPAPGPSLPGAVLILAGLGGPDAVRQLLGEISKKLPVPVLVHQHLDTGKHDRLVSQLGKSSILPVELAVEGQPVVSGHVFILPNGIGVRGSANALQFAPVASVAALVRAMPAADCAVLVLSGASPEALEPIMELRAAGALVLAQPPSACFDATVAQAVVDAGCDEADAASLGLRLSARWNF